MVSRDPLQHQDAFPHEPVRSLATLARLPSSRLVRSARTAALSRSVSEHEATIIHVHFGYAVHDVLGTTRRRSLPLVLSLHGDDVTALPRRSPDHYRAVVDAVDALVVPSRWLADRCVELGFDDGRISVIPSGVDTSLFTPTPLPDGPPLVAFVGRLVEKKGLDTLVAAWPTVRSAAPDATLVVLGDGPLRPLVDRVDGTPGIQYEVPDPARRHHQVRDLLRRATVVCTPSRTAGDGDAESLLLVNLEAQASARPVVTTRHGGIPEFVVEGRSALVVPEADSPALAAAMIDVLTDADLAARLAAAGPEVARRFDAGVGAAAVDRLYDELESGSPRGR